MRNLILKLLKQSKQATPEQLARLIHQASLAPFATDLLEVDEPLWGGFWQGDVIAPGYRLPAAELALLRASRLDHTWPEGTTVAEFLADLRQAILDPRAGVWALLAAGEPCLIFAAPAATQNPKSLTVVWYCATTGQLHAGYRVRANRLNLEAGVEQRPPVLKAVNLSRNEREAKPQASAHRPGWLERLPERGGPGGGQPLAARLDAAIWRLRRRRRAFKPAPSAAPNPPQSGRERP